MVLFIIIPKTWPANVSHFNLKQILFILGVFIRTHPSLSQLGYHKILNKPQSTMPTSLDMK